MAEFLDQRSARLIGSVFDVDELEAHAESVYAMDPLGTLIYVNPAWHRFARENGERGAPPATWSVGANVFDAISGPLQAFYRDLFAGVPCFGDSLEPLSFSYECSSADLFRCYNMLVYALPDVDGHPGGYLVVNSLLEERPHEREPYAAVPEDYVDEQGILHQCAHCRRVKSLAGNWNWVREWVEARPANASHGLCPVCLDYFFGAG